jgi:Tfp pilus assembly protein PilW
MYFLDNSTEFSRCWNSNAKIINQGSSYISTEGTKKKSYIDPSEYEKSDVDTSNNNNSNTSSNAGINRILFIGDSRTVQMYAYLTNDWNGANYSSGGVHNYDGNIIVAQGSMGLDWMRNTGVPAAKQYFTSGTAIVIMMGVNDLSNIDNYISYINENYSSWTSNGARVYFATVNPCLGSYAHLNSSIDSFNSRLKSSLPSGVKVIDTNNYLMSEGYVTTDGLHYDKTTSESIYNYIKSNV